MMLVIWKANDSQIINEEIINSGVVGQISQSIASVTPITWVVILLLPQIFDGLILVLGWKIWKAEIKIMNNSKTNT